MSKIRICFMGTPVFAERCLAALLDDEHFEVVGVVTQPDRPAGRKLQLTPSPVKDLASKRAIPFVTPESLRKSPEAVATIQSWGAEMAVVVAFGQILTEDFMNIFKFGCVNVHASLLPRWRGAAPIQRAIEAGDSVTGVCIQKMVKQLDAGDVIAERKVQIGKSMTARELHDELCLQSIDILRVDLMDYVRGNLAPRSQDESLVTYAKKIEKQESEIDWNNSAYAIDCKIRAFNMGPGTHTTWNGKKLKIITAFAQPGRELENPGRILSVLDLAKDNAFASIASKAIEVGTGQGTLMVTCLQPESKSVMSVDEFLRGNQINVGDHFGKLN